jgi:putative ABC transport system permease protein
VFLVTYLARELRRRPGPALLTAAGIAVGIGVVVTVTAASTGVANAQGAVLHSMYGIGTDVTVTSARPPASTTPAPLKGVPTDPRGDVLLAGTLELLDASLVTSIAGQHGVALAAGGLTFTDLRPSPGGGLPAMVPLDGVDLSHRGLGPIASTTVTSGRALTAADAGSNVALIDSGYAAANRLTVGSKITIAGADFVVAGIVRQPHGGGAADVYIPLERAQALAQQQYKGSTTFAGKVNTIYVAAASASDIPAVRAEISRLLPAATVTSSDSLASAVSGSLAGAARLANDLGRWLSIAVLAAAFAVSSLLTMGAVSRRVRELGTLKALGWSGGRIVAQIMSESVVVGLLGAVLGVALGYGGAALVTAVAPTLSASVASNPDSPHTVEVHLAVPVTATAVVLAVVLALAGSLISGSFGAWRAVRLRPAAALARVA